MSKEWKPEVGQIVNVKTGLGIYRKAEIQHFCNNYATVLFENDPMPALVSLVDLQPIKTDPQREEHTQLIENSVAMFYGDPTSNYQELADFLYDNGCRVLVPDERIVKS